jgi:hypothetical protein
MDCFQHAQNLIGYETRYLPRGWLHRVGNGRTRCPPYRRVVGLQFEDRADKMSTLQEGGRFRGIIFQWGRRLTLGNQAVLMRFTRKKRKELSAKGKRVREKSATEESWGKRTQLENR